MNSEINARVLSGRGCAAVHHLRLLQVRQLWRNEWLLVTVEAYLLLNRLTVEAAARTIISQRPATP